MIGCFITILGIPAGVVLAKSLDTILQPVGKICAPVGVAAQVQAQKDQAAEAQFMNKFNK